jgi:putative spermidine/putrescine transport system ATP-binding protein
VPKHVGLQIEGLEKSFGPVAAVCGIDLTVTTGEFFTLLGPSGCGKTTILRTIAGIYQADRGRVLLDGRDVTAVPMHARDIALVFQNHALFPHMTAFDNIAFGLRMRRLPRREIAGRVDEALALVRLSGLGQRRPAQLSGGQQQRVALARALAVRPRLLLLDEPLSNLDARLRDELREEIRALQLRLGVTTVLVTHDIQEAFAMSDRVAVMQAGRIEQVGVPRELYRAPATRFVAGFLGPTNQFRVVVEMENGTPIGRVPGLPALRLPPHAAACAGNEAWLILRPEHMRLGEDGRDNRFDATIEDIVYIGAVTQARLTVASERLVVVLQSSAAEDLRPGMRVPVGWNTNDAVVHRDE